jgi:small-conductance mechanosensitive channel
MEGELSFLQEIVVSLGENKIAVGQIIGAILSLLFVSIIYLFLNKIFLQPLVVKQREADKKDKSRILRRWILMFFLIGIALVVWILGIDYKLMEFGGRDISLLTLLVILLLLTFSSLIDWIFTYVISSENQEIDRTYERRSKQKFSPGANIQFIIYTIASVLVLRGFNLDFKIFPDKPGADSIDLYFSNLFTALLILLVARLFIWILTHLILARYYRIKKVEYSSQYAINQILTYVIIVMAVIIALENLGIKMTLIWGGAAALLVGVGLGLQQTFNDLISGIILLFERTVEVGAVLEIDGMVGTVRKIGIRTSIIETRDNLTVIVPNSKLIVDKVINWNHNDDKARFSVSVGVAYGSDTELVKKLMLQVAKEHPKLLQEPAPFVRFVDFGDSSLDMELHFWTKLLIPVENIKSDLRFGIDKAFRDHKVTIPFPQRDLWIKTAIHDQQPKTNSSGETEPS